MKKVFAVYIMTNVHKTVLYTGVSSHLQKRAYEHKNKVLEGFTRKYNVDKLVYYEIFDEPHPAIAREKQLKAGSRQKKLELINKMNPEWRDLYNEL